MGGHEKATKRTAGELDRVLQGWLDEHKLRRKLRDETGESDGEQAFMDVMLSVLEDKEKKIHADVADTVNKSTCTVQSNHTLAM